MRLSPFSFANPPTLFLDIRIPELPMPREGGVLAERGFSMHYSSSDSLRRRIVLLLLFASFGLICCRMTVVAQGSGRDTTGTGGSSIITGKIFFPSGRRADGTIQVKLTSYTSSDITVLADSSGSFTFASIAPGNYTVEVNAGKEYEIAHERVDVDQPLQPPRGSDTSLATVSTTRRYTVMITLQPKAFEERGKPSVVNAALADVPEDARSLYEKALTLSQNGDTVKAIEDLKMAISIYPKFPLALNQLGVEYLKSGDARRAVDPLRSATKLSPDAFSPKLNLGIALLETHDFSNADTQLRQALKISSTPAAHMYLGLTLVGVKQYDEAQHELETAISTGGENLGQAHRYLGGIYWMKHDNQRAIDEFEAYLRLAPNAPDAERVRGTIKELRGK
jgi:tetratricopeptide (TPR) repeat protein